MYRLLLVCMVFSAVLFGQDFDKLSLQESYQYTLPQNFNEFFPVFHFPPVNQDTTYVCWSFSTLSFLESELKRLGHKPVKLAVMYPVYFSMVEKAKKFVKSEGKSRFTPGDLFPTVLSLIKKYGIVPESVYPGNPRKYSTYNHDQFYAEIDQLKTKFVSTGLWDENEFIAELKIILDRHLGEPPQNFRFESKNYTPLSFRNNFVPLDLNDYIAVTSFLNGPFLTQIPLNVPDNWKPDSTYLNLPLDRFYEVLKNSLKNGYSVAIDSDINEPGRIGRRDMAFIPRFDICHDNITQSARQFRFNTGQTTDDHLMHIVGFNIVDGQDWFLVKDSWRDAFEGTLKGYFYLHESYIKLKVLAFLVHKDALNF